MLKKIILALAVLILALGVGFYIYSDFVSHRVANIPTEPKTDFGENQQIEQVEQLEYPDLDRPLTFPSGFPLDAQKIIKESVEKLVSELKQNPGLFDNWLELGIRRKTIKDYEGAEEAWEYAGAISPLNSVSFNNLGDLYAYYLKDYKKAEENFLTAIKNGPDQVYIYRSFYEFYRNVLKDNAKARAILEKGIAANPDTSQDLKYLLDNF